jgi:hypothetical protein
MKMGCIQPIHFNKQSMNILLELYQDIKNADDYIHLLKKQRGINFYNMTINSIQTISQIPKPTTFHSDGFPPNIRKHIDNEIVSKITYSIYLLDRKITIHFLLEEHNIERKIHLYNNYIDNILMWLVILNKYSSKKCVKELTIYIYLTTKEKNIPTSNIFILDEYHVNTAFTTTCPKISEIVIFRKEEWFKVLIHETFHNFGLDFSSLNNNSCHKRILNIFPVNSEVNLFEAYSETWAKIINAIFCSYHNLRNKNNTTDFLNNFAFFINVERMFCYFQMVKVLDFMNLTYEQLYKKDIHLKNIRNTLYKEKTNVLSYYVITLILLNNVNDFFTWCSKNNTNLLQFAKMIGKQDDFCMKLIEKKYKSTYFLKNIKCVEQILYSIKNKSTEKYKKETKYILNNLRMSICELG